MGRIQEEFVVQMLVPGVPHRVGSVKLGMMSQVLYHGRNQNSGLTWGFSAGYYWSVRGDTWPAEAAAAVSRAAPPFLGPPRPPNRLVLAAITEHSSALRRQRALVVTGVDIPWPVH